MKALSLIQPYATLIMLGYDYKWHETRSWKTEHRGPLAIHASAGKPLWARQAAESPLIKAALDHHGLTFADLPRGAILGTVDLVAVKKMVEPGTVIPVLHQSGFIDPATLTPMELAAGDWTPGRFAWQLENRQQLEAALTCTGSLSLWQVPAEVETQFIFN